MTPFSGGIYSGASRDVLLLEVYPHYLLHGHRNLREALPGLVWPHSTAAITKLAAHARSHGFCATAACLRLQPAPQTAPVSVVRSRAGCVAPAGLWREQTDRAASAQHAASIYNASKGQSTASSA